MKVYIASSSNFIAKCKMLAKRLEDELGFEITRKWWEHYIKDEPKFRDISDEEFYAHPQVHTIRELDLMAVRESDFVVVITQDRYKLTGAMRELGEARAHHIPVYMIGKFKRSAMISDCIFVQDMDQLIVAFRRFQ